jgi:hypothetical protein
LTLSVLVLTLLLKLMMLAHELFLHAWVHGDRPRCMISSHLGLQVLMATLKTLPMLHLFDPIGNIRMLHTRIHLGHAIFCEPLFIMGIAIERREVQSELQEAGKVVFLWGGDHRIMVMCLGPQIAGLIHGKDSAGILLVGCRLRLQG